jgi:hypothetical protein
MSFLLALFLVVHASIHIGYICGPAWPFVATDPWLLTAVGASSDAARTVGIALVLVAFVAYMLAAVTVTGFARSLWRPLIVVASVASAIVLVLFGTPWTLPGLAIDAALLWATLVQGRRPAPVFDSARHAPRPAARRHHDEGAGDRQWLESDRRLDACSRVR